MPYRISSDGKCVEKKEGGIWHIYKCYEGSDAKNKARKLNAALQIVEMKENAKRSD